MKYLIKEYILKTGQTQSFTLYTKKVTQMIQIITGVFLSLMLVESCLVLFINRRLQMWVDMDDTLGEQQAGSGKTIQQLIIYLPCLLLYKNNCL